MTTSPGNRRWTWVVMPVSSSRKKVGALLSNRGSLISGSTQRDDADDRGFVGTFGPGHVVLELSSPRRDTRTAIRRDGLEMFITTNRAGSVPDPSGQPSLDLWVSTRPSTGDPWSTPANLGLTINTPAADGGPALSCDGTALYFYSTRRPGGIGEEDLYVTTRHRIHGEGGDDDERDDGVHPSDSR